jgi:two-component system OmpR family sensor kinase
MKNLQSRLILSFTLVILVTLCGVSVIYTVLIARNPQQERITYLNLNTQARSIVAVLKRLPNFNPSNATRFQLLEELSERQEVRVAWATVEQRVIYDSAHVWDTGTGDELFMNLNRNPLLRWSGRIRDTGKIWLVVAHPIPDPPDEQNYLILAQPLNRPLLSTISQLRDTVAIPLLQAGAIALAMGIILSITISRSIVKPLKQVSTAAQTLAEGNYDVSVKTKGPQEIQHLAAVFNEMAQQIKASHQAQNDLVANVAHDLRTPLTSIQGYAQALIDGTAAQPESRLHAAQTIYEESRRMDRMAKTLLDLSRFQAGEIKLQFNPVNLVQLAEERIDFYQRQAEDAGLTLEMHASTGQIIVQADKERIIQVLDNLLSNAVTYTMPGGGITVEVAVDTDKATIAVTDSGIGISSDELPRIFERFYRGDKSRQGSGTGLGLSIVKEIVTAHHGEVFAESIAGVGSKFTFYLPLDPRSSTVNRVS